MRSSADTIDFSGQPHIDQFLVTGPFNPTGVGRHAEPPRDLRVQPAAPSSPVRAKRALLREKDPHAAGAPRVSRRPDRRRPARSSSTSTSADGSRPARSTAASTWRCAACSPARSSSCASNRIPPVSRRERRTRSRDLALASRLSFFLWSSIPDDELLDGRGEGRVEEARRARPAGAPDAGGSEGRGARQQLRGSVAVPAQSPQQGAELVPVPRLRRRPPPRDGARGRTVLQERHATRTETSSI